MGGVESESNGSAPPAVIGAESSRVAIYRRVDLPLLLAGIIAGVIALSVDAWWVVRGVESSQIISVQASPFFLRIQATGLSDTMPGAGILGGATRILTGFASLLLIVSSIKRTVWWKNLAEWFNLAVIVEMFLSLVMMVNFARQLTLAAYGAALPVVGTTTLPFNMIGLDQNFYMTPTVSAEFAPIFYAGIACAGLIAYERVMSLKIIQEYVASGIGSIRELTLAPPYDRVWVSTDDSRINPLSEDPALVGDERLALSLGKMYETVSPGGIVTILLPTWAAWFGDKIKSLIDLVGFKLDSSDLVSHDGDEEMELVLRKPSDEKEGGQIAEDARAEAVETENQTMVSSSSQTIEPISPAQLPAERPKREEMPVLQTRPLVRVAQQPLQMPQTRRELEMVRSAVKLISNSGAPVVYRMLLNDVYLDLLEHKIEFESAREIERVLTSHVGHELVLIDEETPDGKIIRKWWIGEGPVGRGSPGWEAVARLKVIGGMTEDKMKSLKRRLWTRRSGYHSRRRAYDEDSSSRT